MSTRPWVVSLRARSAVRLQADKLINIRADAKSTVPVAGVRIRNLGCINKDGTKFVGALVAEAAGYFDTVEEAANRLGNLASPYFQVAAVAANAAVDEPEDMLCSAPPLPDGTVGRFVVQLHSQPRAPAAVVRDLPVQAFSDLLQALNAHAREDRLHRAMAHYRLALGNMAFQAWMLAGESLYVAVENLARVVTQRLQREAGFPDTPEGKHLLALSVGIRPASDRDRSHLRRLDSWVRQDKVFGGDGECYKQLLAASDAFEHGHEGFDFVRARTDAVTRRAFGLVRRAILTELGVPPESELFAKRFDIPLGDWRPVLELDGEYTDDDPTAFPDLSTPDHVNDNWPEFVGPTITPVISKMVDVPDGRTVSLTTHGDAKSMLATQKVRVVDHRWIVPSGKEAAPVGNLELTQVLLNGNDVTEQHGGPDIPATSKPEESGGA